jgi:hypothetical protein
MNAPSSTEADLDTIEAVYHRLKPLRDLEADVRGWKVCDWRGILAAIVVTVSYLFMAVAQGGMSLMLYLGGLVTMLTWLGLINAVESKRVSLVTASLRAIADELHELRKKQA